MVISRKRSPIQPSLSISGNPICQVNSFCFPGVSLSSDLSWSKHINTTHLKAKKHLGFIYRQFHSAGRRTISQLYKSTVLPFLDYCSCVWDPYQVTYVSMLAKIATGHWSVSHDDLCTQLGWPPLSSRRKFQKLSLCHRILSGCFIISPESFIPHPSPNLRHSHNLPLYQPPTRTQAHLGSYFPSVVPIWNSLPSDIVTSHSHLSFKHKPKPYLNL